MRPSLESASPARLIASQDFRWSSASRCLGPRGSFTDAGYFGNAAVPAKKVDPVNATNRQARTPARLTRGPNQPSRDGFRTSEKTPKANSPTVPMSLHCRCWSARDEPREA